MKVKVKAILRAVKMMVIARNVDLLMNEDSGFCLRICYAERCVEICC